MRALSSFGRWLKNFRFTKSHVALGAIFVFVLAIGLLGPTHFTLAEESSSFLNTSWNTFMLLITKMVNALTAGLAWMTLSIIEMLLVPILQYNGFSTSPTVGLGWSLVRDVVNMFVVLVLIVIAIATIVGYDKVHWQKNLPQFLLAIILVNFSRTICGILIDISQVVMFTFVNALLDVGASNFATLLRMDIFGQYSGIGTEKNIDSGSGIVATQQLIASYLLFVLYGSILAVMLLLALVYIWRIVMLWVLVILSPLTFFTWGLGGMFKFAGGMGADWWKKFTACLIIGPMLTFFVWLALTTATTDIIDSENFVQPSGEATAGQTLLKSLETSNLLATFLGLVLLVVGMQQSAASANSMGGIAKKALGDDKAAQALVGRIARTPFTAASRAAVATAGYVDRQAGLRLGHDSLAEHATVRTMQGTSRMVSNLPVVGGALGRTVAGVGGSMQAQIEHAQEAQKKAAKDRVAHWTPQQFNERARMIAEGAQPQFSMAEIDNDQAVLIKALTDGDSRKKFKTEMPDKYNELMMKAVRMKDAVIKGAGGDLDKAAKARSQNVHLLDDKPKDGERGKDDEIVKFIDSDKFNPRDMSEDAVKDGRVLDALKNKTLRTGKNGVEITAYQDLIKGIYGKKLKDVAIAAERARGNGSNLPSVEDEDESDGDDDDSGSPSSGASPTVALGNVPGSGFNGPRRPPRGGGGSGGSGGGSSGGGSGPAGAPPAAGGGVPPVAPSGGGGVSAAPSRTPKTFSSSPSAGRAGGESTATAGPLVSFGNAPVIPENDRSPDSYVSFGNTPTLGSSGAGTVSSSSADNLVSFDDGSRIPNAKPAAPAPVVSAPKRRPPGSARPARRPPLPPRPPAGSGPIAQA